MLITSKIKGTTVQVCKVRFSKYSIPALLPTQAWIYLYTELASPHHTPLLVMRFWDMSKSADCSLEATVRGKEQRSFYMISLYYLCRMSSKYFILYPSYYMLVFQLLPKCKFMCMTHSEIKQYQNIRIRNKERFIKGHARRWVAHA